MHIALIRTIFDRAHGGAERYAVNLAKLWRDQGHEITVVCQRANPHDTEGMNVSCVSRPKLLGPYKHRWFAKLAGEAALESRADRVLALARAWPGDVARIGDGLHAMWMRARYASGHERQANWNPRHRQILKLEREMFADDRFRHFVVNSQMMRDGLAEYYDVAERKITVIPNGVDFDRFCVTRRSERQALLNEVGIPGASQVALFSGMDFRRKGLMRAVEAFVEVAKQHQDIWFLCVGRGDGSTARDRLRDAGLSERSTFLDVVSDMGRVYAASDVFVLPTLHDPSANSVTESLACGTPVVTTTANGACQHIVEGVNGVVVEDRNDTGALAKGVERCLGLSAGSAVRDGSKLISVAENAEALLQLLMASRGVD